MSPTAPKNALDKLRVLHVFVLATSLPALGFWLFSRVESIGPAILGDEYIYSMGARKSSPWSDLATADFSNYLFNFVYSSTSICGEAFYSCAKALNIVFFLASCLVLFAVALRFLPFWLSFLFYGAVAISPVSIYTSMFLPESLYLFLINVVLYVTLRAVSSYTIQNWTYVGVAVGLASLVKPHAWMSLVAILAAATVFGLAKGLGNLRITLASIFSSILAAIMARIVVGLMVGGPKTVGFFGSYVSSATFEELGRVADGAAGQAPGIPPLSPMAGVAALFVPQFGTHLITTAALTSLGLLSISGVTVALILRRLTDLSDSTKLALLVFIWWLALMIQIVMFTGWVTGQGDDHSLRVLLRYYDFTNSFIWLAGLVTVWNGTHLRVNWVIRWTLAGGFLMLLSAAFTSYFVSLSIQIADAPGLAGLIVNRNVFNTVAVVAFLGVMAYALFPNFLRIAMIALPITLISTGWQIQEQYEVFRGDKEPAEVAGVYLRDNLDSEDLKDVLVVTDTRFNATLAGFHIDAPGLDYLLAPPGAALTSDSLDSRKSIVLFVGDYEWNSPAEELARGTGYSIYRRLGE